MWEACRWTMIALRHWHMDIFTRQMRFLRFLISQRVPFVIVDQENQKLWFPMLKLEDLWGIAQMTLIIFWEGEGLAYITSSLSDPEMALLIKALNHYVNYLVKSPKDYLLDEEVISQHLEVSELIDLLSTLSKKT